MRGGGDDANEVEVDDAALMREHLATPLSSGTMQVRVRVRVLMPSASPC